MRRLKEKIMVGVTMPVSFSGDVLRSMKRRYRGTEADTGFVTVTDRRS